VPYDDVEDVIKEIFSYDKIGITDNTVDNKNECNDDKISNKTDKSVR